jgi:lactate dehydrogenase-like 2-hydroxyacid dehydrogenase
MNNQIKKFKKVVVLDTVIFYPEHRKLLNKLSEQVLEYPSSLPEGLEKQYQNNPELFINKRCYSELATNDTPKQLLMNRVDGADVIISCWTNIPDEILKLNPQLKLIVFWTHEKEHRVNMKLAEELGIKVVNVPDYGTESVTEAVFAGIWQLIQKNYQTSLSTDNENQTCNAIIDYVFTYFRKLPTNEKNTRSGKFTHHFHKIGQAKFDFDQKSIDQLIPERLVKDKKVGLLNIQNANETIDKLRALEVNCEKYEIKDDSLATFYKFLTENEIVFYDKTRVDPDTLEKISIMFNNKLVDITALPRAEYSLTNKTFGIVGLGRIGTTVATTAKKLGLKVVYYSKTRKPETEKELDIEYVSLEELARTCDIVSIHVPAYKAENMFNKDLINKLKNKSIFINTADGNAIDQKTLTDRMVNHEIFAYLDVYPGLPRKDIMGLKMKDNADWKIKKELSNHVLAYRVGWKTQESIRVKTYKLIGHLINHLTNNDSTTKS